jgi:hypothetical protein
MRDVVVSRNIGLRLARSKALESFLAMYQSLNHVLFDPVMPYELFALKNTPEPMLGSAHRLARRVREVERKLGRGVALDKSFAAQADDTDEGPQFLDVIEHEDCLIFSIWWRFLPPEPG